MSGHTDIVTSGYITPSGKVWSVYEQIDRIDVSNRFIRQYIKTMAIKNSRIIILCEIR